MIDKNKKTCGRCGKTKNRETGFYKSASDTTDSHMNMCRVCVIALFKKYFAKIDDCREAFLVCSQKLDLYTDGSIINDHIEKLKLADGDSAISDSIIESYIDMTTRLTTIHCMFSATQFGGEPFKYLFKKKDSIPIYSNSDDLDEKFKNLANKWGLEDKNDLLALETSWQNLDEAYDLSGLNTQILVKQLCLEELRLTQLRVAGGNTEKALKAVRDLMSDLNLTPKKSNALSSATFDSLGSAIKIFEERKPIINKDPEFEDVDKIQRMHDSMIGALQRTLQQNTEYVQKFETNYKKYCVDLEEDSSDDDL